MPHRLGPLDLGPVSELVLARPRIEVFESGGAASAGQEPAAAARPDGEDVARTAPPLPGLGAALLLATATLYDPTFTFVRDGAPVARLEAARARASAGKRDLVLRGVRVEQVPAGRRLTAERAVWLADADALWIEGEYVLWDGAASTRGRGLRIDVRLRR